MTERALDAAAVLAERGVAAGVLHVPTIKPFDADAVAEFAAGVDRVVTAENHVVRGGLASQVVEALFDAGVQRPVARIGLPDRFIECGSVPTLQARYGLTAEAIVATAAMDAMKITEIETFTVGAGWKNWLFVRVHTDAGIHGVGEGTLNGFIATTEAGVHELKHLAIGQDPRRIGALWQADARQRVAGRRAHPPDGDRGGRGGLLGHPRQDPRRADPPAAGRAGARQRARLRQRLVPDGADAGGVSGGGAGGVGKGFQAFKLDPFGTAQGFIERDELELAYAICRKLRDELPADTRILIDVHARFTEIAALKAAERFADLGIYWWEEPTSRDRQETVHEVARRSPIPVATGEMYDTVGQFYALAEGGGVNIFQPEPMSLGGIGPAMQVAGLAAAHGSWIAPHQSGGPVATAVCLQLAAAVPNFLIQEHFDAFNEPWTRELVTWQPEVDRGERAPVAAGGAGAGDRPQHRGDRGASLRSACLSQRSCEGLGGAPRDGAGVSGKAGAETGGGGRQAAGPGRRARDRAAGGRGADDGQPGAVEPRAGGGGDAGEGAGGDRGAGFVPNRLASCMRGAGGSSARWCRR